MLADCKLCSDRQYDRLEQCCRQVLWRLHDAGVALPDSALACSFTRSNPRQLGLVLSCHIEGNANRHVPQVLLTHAKQLASDLKEPPRVGVTTQPAEC